VPSLTMFENSPTANVRASRSLVVSLAIHGAAVIAIFAAHFSVQAVSVRRESRMQFVSPSLGPLKKHVALRPTPRIKIPFTARLPLPLARRAPALIEPLQPPVIQAPPILPEPILVASVAPPQMPVAPASAFSAAVAANGAPNTKSPVRTGGFGAASAFADPTIRAMQTAAVGFGDATVGTAPVARRSVSYSGFGDTGVAATTPGYRGSVRSGGFGDAVSTAPIATPARPLSAQPAIAALILEKPRPAYTEEARRLQIEGEVQLEVLFGASGEIHILRVIRGLGHGLDENAALAARAIRFVPAKREGRAVDSTALVHIVFQLAS
jgi:TonB family protein